jgi:RNA polymerase sigma factor (sigma-70 family)
MSSQDSKLTTSDQELIESARSGDTSAFAELWRRHYRSAVRVARQFTSSLDADDLVSEAYARIFQRVLAGGGPTGAFRPYLYTTIRNLASSWGAAAKDVQVDVIEEFEDERIPDDPAAWALDRTLTAKAFRALPDRWQTVLWYTEVEGMDPHEVAPLMGLTANGVAALSYRAREGLRTAWLQAHISDAGISTECQRTMSRLGDRARNGLTAREKERVEQHLLECTKCSVISEEVEEVGSHLAMVMLPVLLGGIAGGALLAALAHPTSALAAEIVPALPAAVHAVAAGSVLSAAILGGISMGAASGAGALVGSLAIIAAIGGGVTFGIVAIGSPLAIADSSQRASVSGVDTATAEPSGEPSGAFTASPSATDPANSTGLGATVDGSVGGAAGGVTGLVNGVTAPIAAPIVAPTVAPIPGGAPAVSTTVDLHLTGGGTPGATVSASVAGAVYTTVVNPNGSWAINVTGLPQTTTGANASVTQKVLLRNGSLGVLLGPLSLDVNSLGLHVSLLN